MEINASTACNNPISINIRIVKYESTRIKAVDFLQHFHMFNIESTQGYIILKARRDKLPHSC